MSSDTAQSRLDVPAIIKWLRRKNRELLLLVLIVAGASAIAFSFTREDSDERDIMRSFGLSLVPAGVVSLLLSRYAADITETLLQQTVETAIRERLQENVAQLDENVGKRIEVISQRVSTGIEKIEREMIQLNPLFVAASKFGLENVHLNRCAALDSFAPFLNEEITKSYQNEQARVWIVSLSSRGFLDATAENFDGREMLQKIVASTCNLRILMTTPDVGDKRAAQEQRGEGEIAQEVRLHLAYLKRIGVKREEVRFYSGSATVFAVATTNRMLLNPYPYETEAFRCFTITVHETLNGDNDIFHQYLRYHFEQPWHNATEITPEQWDKMEKC